MVVRYHSLAYLNRPENPTELSRHWIEWVRFLYPCFLDVQIVHICSNKTNHNTFQSCILHSPIHHRAKTFLH